MGNRKSDKQFNYSHRPAQTKKQVGLCVVLVFLVHGQAMGKHGFTRLTTAQIWGKPPPSPFIGFFMFGHGANTQMSFSSETPKLGVSKFLKLGLSQLWRPITSSSNLQLK
jgi:hypothetical protein